MAINPSVINLSALNGTNGFQISGEAADDLSGLSVASAGDVNGDGFADLIIGASFADPNGLSSGASYVVFGKASGFAANLNLSALAGADGFQISGEAGGDLSGRSVASAGDVNGDGFADLIIGADGADPNGNYSGASYVVFGNSSGFAANLNLSTLDGSSGFQISGEAVSDFSGASVASAGDVNGDGFADLIIGAGSADPNGNNSGASYVVFGKASGFAANLNLSTLDGVNGFQISGEAVDDFSGRPVASAGDVNGDGFADLIIGAGFADPNGLSSGASYVVFGKASGFAANLSLSALNGTNGFQISGEAAYDGSGRSVASAGDVNGDGFADLIIGAEYADPNGLSSGASYVVFGTAAGFSANLQLSSLDGTNGFQINGEASGDLSGRSVASAGDVNGDGFADLIVGALFADPNGVDSGASYVVFGKASGFAANLNLSTLDGSSGFQISGEAVDDRSGVSVASAGDVNGDGFADLIIGAGSADPNGNNSGASYVVFGSRSLSSVTITGTAFGLTHNGGFGDDEVYGLDGDDKLFGWEGDDLLSGGADNDTLDGGAGDDNLDGGSGNDSLRGGADSDIIRGGSGGDTLDGGTGADDLIGGSGNDTYVTDGFDTIIEALASGTDTVSATDSFVLGSNLEILNLLGTASISGTGNTLANTITGNAAANILDGGAGIDILTGGAGNDTYIVDNAADNIGEAAGQGTLDVVRASVTFTLGVGDHIERLETTNGAGTAVLNLTGNEFGQTILGNAGANRLTGAAGNDSLSGFASADTLDGGTGNDTLAGGTGLDTLTGGSNNDTFVFNTALNAATNRDTITDFSNVGQNDVMHLENTGAGLFTLLAAGALNANFFKANATGAATDADDRIIYNTATGALFYDTNGSVAGGATQFATLTTRPALTAADFFVI